MPAFVAIVCRTITAASCRATTVTKFCSTLMENGAPSHERLAWLDLATSVFPPSCELSLA